MFSQPFSVSPHNSHYVGSHDEGMMEWRRICGIEKADNLQALLRDRKVESVLEVGCGTGAVLAEVARRGIGSRHVGIDIADPTDHADPGAANLTLLAYDGNTLPFPASSFDLVYASHVVEHVLNPRSFLSEIARVAKSFLYVEVPCELHARISRAALQRTLDIGHINSYTPHTFLMLLQTSGLQVVELEIFDHTKEVHRFRASPLKATVKMNLRRALARMSPSLAPRIFTYHCGALAQMGAHRAGADA
jgi:SAM-dependent methyltransferase